MTEDSSTAYPRAAGVDDPSLDTAPPKKRELPSRKNTSVRNLTWAIGLNLILVAIAAAVFAGLGRDDRNFVDEEASLVNVAESAERASETLGFRALAIDPEGWNVRSARVDSAEPRSWRVQYTSPGGELVTLVQTGVPFSSYAAKLDGHVLSGAYEEISGHECSQFTVETPAESGGDPTRATGIECSLEDSYLVVYGGHAPEHVRDLATRALSSGN